MTYSKNNFKSPHIFLFWGLFVVLDIGLITNYVLTEKHDLLYLIGIVSFFLILLYIIGFMTKITIDAKGVHYKSIFKSYSMKWSEIKTIEVYRLNKYFLTIEKPENYDKFSLLGQKFIYFSSKENHIPNKTEKMSSQFISLHWRKEVWDEVHKYILIKK